MLSILTTLIAGLFMIGGLVIVHEAGHYVVARLFKIGTPVFSIGMGPRVFGFHFWETDFRISLLPIGGYVRMAGADAFGEEDADADWRKPEEDFMRRPVWQRLLVMLAGPAANLVLPFILFTSAYMFGQPMPDAVVGRVVPGSAADEAGLMVSDEVVAVAEQPVRNWREFHRALRGMSSDADTATVTVRRAGSEVELSLSLASVPERDFFLAESMGVAHNALSARVGVSDAASPAWKAGLRTGDLVEEVDGTAVRTFTELQAALTPGSPHTVKAQHFVVDGDNRRVAEPTEFRLEPDPSWAPDPTEVLPDPWGLIPIEVFVSSVVEDPPSAALAAGVKEGDRLVSIDGSMVRSWDDVVELVKASADEVTIEQAEVQSGGCRLDEAPILYGRPLRLEVARDGARKVLEFRPQIQRMVRRTEVLYRPIMGVRPYSVSTVPGAREPTYYGVGSAFALAVEDSVNTVRDIGSSLGGLLQGRLKAKETLGGPVEIFRTAGVAAQRGLHYYIGVMGMISFSLGILNLLPVPVLDGGQILFYTIEGIRGRPLPLALRERVQMIGVLFLGALMVVVLVNDIGRLISG